MVATPQPASVATVAVSRIAPSMDLRVGDNADRGGLRLSGTVGIVVMMGLLTLLPTLLLMMTSFTRILIVLHFLRQALGTQNAPPSQLVAAIALMLTGFVMAPTLTVVNRDAKTVTTTAPNGTTATTTQVSRTSSGATYTTTITRSGSYQPMGSSGYQPVGDYRPMGR